MNKWRLVLWNTEAALKSGLYTSPRGIEASPVEIAKINSEARTLLASNNNKGTKKVPKKIIEGGWADSML